MKINNRLQFFIPFVLLGIKRHELPLKRNIEKVVAQKYKMLFVINIITIEEGIAELTFKLHLATDLTQNQT